jgi:methylamine utilization protein MauE
MSLLAPPFFAGAGLVVASGAAKLRLPGPAGRALAALRLPSGRWAVRSIGSAEIAIGMWCLLAPGRASAVSLATLYAAFALFLASLMRFAGPDASCGCLGGQEARPSLLHIVLDVSAAATAVLISLAPPRSVIAFAVDLRLGALPFVLGTALIAYLAYLAVAYLPEVFWSYDRSAAGSHHGPRARRFALDPMGDR